MIFTNHLIQDFCRLSSEGLWCVGIRWSSIQISPAIGRLLHFILLLSKLISSKNSSRCVRVVVSFCPCLSLALPVSSFFLSFNFSFFIPVLLRVVVSLLRVTRYESIYLLVGWKRVESSRCVRDVFFESIPWDPGQSRRSVGLPSRRRVAVKKYLYVVAEFSLVVLSLNGIPVGIYS